MHPYSSLAIALSAVLLLNGTAYAETEQNITVSRIIDGDTIEVVINDNKESIRIIGIDTPETVHPSKPVECFGKEASAKMKELLAGGVINLVKNPAEERDKYDRLLRYVEIDSEDIGAIMIRDGLAFSYKAYPHPRLDHYNELEREANEANRGLWGDCAQDEGNEFSDVSGSHPYGEAIRWGKRSNVLSGYPDGTFQPDRTVNRAEFLKIVLGAPGIDVHQATNPTGFTDVDENAWYIPYVRYAKAQGIIEGYADGTFKPEQAVNFAEALKMAYVALGIHGDESAAGEWYEKYLRHAKDRAVLFSNNVNVGEGMSRKDVVWIVWRLSSTENNAPASKSSVAPRSSAASSAISSVNDACVIKGNISAKDEKIYHVPGCQSYNQTVINTSDGERMFCSESEAEAAGWRKALNCP